MSEVCANCPFLRWPEEVLLEKRERVDRGGWEPCMLTAAPAVMPEGMTHHDIMRLMRNEVECTGARIWRRDRKRPQRES